MRIRRRYVVGSMALAVAAAGVALVWTATPLVPDQVASLLNQSLLRERGLRLELARVSGMRRGGFLFLHPVLRSADPSGRIVLRADALQVRARHLWRVFQGRAVLAELRLERPQLELPLPPARAPRRTSEALAAPRLVVDRFVIVDGDVSRSDSTGVQPLVAHLDAELGLQVSARGLRADVRRASGTWVPDSLQIEALEANVQYRADTLTAGGVRLRSGTSVLEGSGIVAPGLGRWSVRSEPIELAALARVVGRSLPAGRLAGRAQIEWHGSRFEASGEVEGQVEEVDLAAVTLAVAGDGQSLRVRRLEGSVGGARVAASAVLDRRSGGLRGEIAVESTDLRRLVPQRYQPSWASRMPPHAVAGSARFARPTGRDSLQVEAELGPVDIDRFAFRRLAGRVRVKGNGLRALALQADGPWGMGSATGRVGAETVDGDVFLQLVDLGPILERAGLRGLHGDLEVRAHLSGEMRRPDLVAETRFARVGRGAIELASGTLAVWGRCDPRAPTLALEVRADTLLVAGRRLRGLGADLDWADGALRVERSQAAAGDTLVAAVGVVDWPGVDWRGVPRPRGTRVRLETALVQLRGAELRVEDPASLWVYDRTLHLDSLLVLTRAGQMALAGDIDLATGALAARSELGSIDLGFIGDALDWRHQVEGAASGWVSCSGNWSRARLAGDLHVVGGSWNGLAFDSLSATVSSDAHTTRISRLRCVTPRGAVRGWLELGYLPRVVRREGFLRLRSELEAAPIAGRLHFNALDLDLARARAPGAAPLPVDGSLSAVLALGGTVERPRLELLGRAVDLRTRSVHVDSLTFDLACHSDSLLVRAAELDIGDGVLHLSGRFPTTLHLLRGFRMQGEMSMDLRAVLPRTSFAAVERFLPLFVAPPAGLPRGEVEGEVRLVGRPGAPRAEGGFRVRDASFVLQNMEEIWREVNADGIFAGQSLRIVGLTGRSGKKGVVTGQGEVRFAGLGLGGYEFDLVLDRIPVRTIPEMSAIVSGDLKVHSVRIGRKLVPDLRGTFAVVSAEIRQEFNTGTQGGSLETDVPEWLSDLTLQAPQGKVWVRNSVVDAELAGDLQVMRRRSTVEILGQVRVKRGTYSYLIHRFEVTRGELDFTRNPGFNPELDIEGRTGRSGERTYITLTGSALTPHLAFRSEASGKTAEEAQQELLAVDPTTGDNAAAVSAVTNIAEQALKDLALLQDLSIDPTRAEDAASATGLAASPGFDVTAGRSVSDRVFLLYTHGFNSDLEQRVSVEVDLNNFLLMESKYERRSVSTAGVGKSQNQFEVNLKFRHEY